MRIDLHTHSSVSDGTESPADLLATAAGRRPRRRRAHRPRHHRRLGGRRGGPAARADRRPRHGAVLPLVPRRHAADQRPPAGLPVRPARTPGFAAERARLRDERLERGERIVTALAADGYPVVWDADRRALARAASSAARTSPAPWWTPASSSRSTTPSPRCCTTAARTTSPRSTPTSARASRWSARPAGCRCSPTGWPPSGAGSSATTRSPRWPRPACWAWRSTTPTTPPDERAAPARRSPRDLGLIVTGSSDFHGTNKTTPIGACTTDPDQFEAILAAGTGSAPFRD